MSINVLGYAAQFAEDDLAPFHFQRRDMRNDDVLIEILYCGVCHTDIHMVRNNWKNTLYPIVPGHEIVGRVASVGTAVTRFKSGDFVAVGCMVDSCQHCSSCEQGLEQYCHNGMILTYNGVDIYDQMRTFGGYSEKIIVREKFVLSLPEGLDLKGAAPLLCAGITTWSPLHHWNIGSNSRVAIVGLGGLGHMAIKLAKALGAHVSLFSRSAGKEQDARRLGADAFILSTNESQMAAVNNSFDLILDTVPYEHDINQYVSTLSQNGTLVVLGYFGPLEPTLFCAPLILGRKTVAGSVIGGIAETQELLDFCGKHHIVAEVEIIKMHEINQAFERMLKSDVKYRFVIDMSSLST